MGRRAAIGSIALILLAFAALTIAGAAGARPQDGPVDGGIDITSATHQNRHALVTWRLAGGWVPDVISVSSSPVTGSDGSFFTENIVDGGILDAGQTRWLSAKQLDFGTYYVRVLSHTEDFSAVEWSETAPLAIERPPPSPPPLPVVRLKMTNGNLRPVTRVHLGDLISVEAEATGSLLSTSSWALRGQTCLVTKSGQRCSQNVIDVTIVPKYIVKGQFSAFARIDGKILARKSLPLKRR